MRRSFENVKAGILIPTYNRFRYFKATLSSALSQSHPRLEILVIDNGCDGETADFMAANPDPRVRYIANEENIGLAGSINKGVRMFSDDVEWCTVLSDDDLLDKDFLRFALQAASEHSAKAVVDGHRIFIDETGATTGSARPSPEIESAVGYLRSRALHLRDTYLTGILFERNSFSGIAGYPRFTTGASSDDAFIFSLALKDKLYHAREAIAYVRIHEAAESRRPSDALLHIRSVNEFRDHVRMVLIGSGRCDEETIRRILGLMDRYVSNLDDTLWIRKANDILLRDRGENKSLAQDLEELLSIAKSSGYLFTRRIRTDVYFLERSGTYMESFLPYRAFWEAWNALKLICLKRISSPLTRGGSSG